MQMSFFLPFSFPSSFFKMERERERERERMQLQYIGGVEGENDFKVYLASSTGFFWDFFFFYGLARFCTAWLEGPLSSCPKFLPLSPEFRRQFQYISSLQLLSWNPVLLLGPELWHQITRPLTATSVLKTAVFIPISADEKGASGFRVLANHLASFFFPHPVRRFVRSTVLTSVCPLLHPRRYIVHIAWPTFFTSFNRQAEELIYIPYSYLN